MQFLAIYGKALKVFLQLRIYPNHKTGNTHKFASTKTKNYEKIIVNRF